VNKVKYKKTNEYRKKGVRYMMCQCGNTYINVGDEATAVRCSYEVNAKIAKMFPEPVKVQPSGRPSGWHFMGEFVDKDGNVFHKGKEQPKLFGTLKPTKVKPKKKPVRKNTEQILLDRHNKKKAILKKAKRLREKVISEKIQNSN